MSVRNLVSTLALAASTLVPVTSHAASLFGRTSSSGNAPSVTVSKAKMVKFKLVNKTASPMTVLINDQPMTLAANSETPVRIAEGTDIFSDDHSTVKLHVTGDLSGNTVSFR
ncbi:hypothetical protein [Terriglobus aquaticus]|uniref:Plastocyanin n=1 Tax=Terriglobus aquaticus TaxID=940139 RepID=A0ABW9KG59_9BACT|nr:hypothetical protein [Terriglobus aquaticus]